MSDRADLKKKIIEIDFAIYELVLFLDTHPTNCKALTLLSEFRKCRRELLAKYEEKYGKLIITTNDAPAEGCWKWLDDPWPWENNFLEG